MDDEAYEAAVLSKSAYDHLREGPEVTQAELLEYGLAGYTLDREFSDDDSVTIVRPDGSVVIAHRGTDSVRDLLPDAAILFGRHAASVGLPFVDDRFDLASRKYERVRAAFPGADISTEAIVWVARWRITSAASMASRASHSTREALRMRRRCVMCLEVAGAACTRPGAIQFRTRRICLEATWYACRPLPTATGCRTA